MNRSLIVAAPLAGAAVIGAGVYALRRRSPGEPPLPRGIIREIDGEQIHYVDEGSGPPVLFIHGFGGSTFSWRNAIESLAANHRVIAIDLPGFGFSDRNPWLLFTHQQHALRCARLLDVLGISRATVVGHSMGGGIAQRLAATFPERVERLVLVASVDASDTARWRRSGERGRFALRVTELVFRSPTTARFLAGRMTRQMVYDPAFITPDFVSGYVQPLCTPGTAACLRRMVEDTREEEPIDLSHISAPTLVVSGEHDRAIPLVTGERLAASIAGARHVVVPEAGHLLAEERPEEFASLVTEFLREPVSAG